MGEQGELYGRAGRTVGESRENCRGEQGEL